MFFTTHFFFTVQNTKQEKNFPHYYSIYDLRVLSFFCEGILQCRDWRSGVSRRGKKKERKDIRLRRRQRPFCSPLPLLLLLLLLLHPEAAPRRRLVLLRRLQQLIRLHPPPRRRRRSFSSGGDGGGGGESARGGCASAPPSAAASPSSASPAPRPA